MVGRASFKQGEAADDRGRSTCGSIPRGNGAAWHPLLGAIARMARAEGADEIVLTAPADSQAVLPMVLSAGLRGRIRMAGETLSVRISVSELRV